MRQECKECSINFVIGEEERGFLEMYAPDFGGGLLKVLDLF
jgi:hypothetical protein